MRILLIPLAAALCLSCSGNKHELQDASDSAVNQQGTENRHTDSLSYYLGMSEGEARDNFLIGTPAWIIDSISDNDYLEAVHKAVTADTVSFSFTEGIKAAREMAYYVNTLEAQGVKINRKLLAERVKQIIATRQTPSEQEQSEADSISNIIILRCLKQSNAPQ